MGRNGKIDFLKFIFAFFIMTLHLGYRPELDIKGISLTLGEKGDFAVVFFFIVSGAFLANAANKKKGKNIEDDYVGFIVKRYRQYMTWYLPAFMLCALLDGLRNGLGCVLKNCLKSIPSLFLLGSLGYSSDIHSTGYYVGASWFLSALFISQVVLYPFMLYKYRFFARVIAPILFIVTFSISVLGYEDNISRALCLITLGVMCYEVKNSMSTLNYGEIVNFCLRVFEAVLYLICLIFMNIRGYEDLYYGMIFVVAFGVTLSFYNYTENSFFNRPIFSFLGHVSFPMYLLHIQLFHWSDYIIKDKMGLEVPDSIYFPGLYVSIVLISIIAYKISDSIIHNRKITAR